MIDKDNRNNCPHADEIVSYIYSEMGQVEQGMFETHLSDCMTCTDEFAGVSHARFAMFEWRKEEFEHLATPEFLIPYENRTPVGSRAGVGFFAGLRGVFAGYYWPVATIAAILMVIGIGLVLNSNLSKTGNDLAAQPKVLQSVPVPVIPNDQPTNAEIIVEQKKVIEPRVETASANISNFRNVGPKVHPQRAVEINRVKKYNQLTAEKYRLNPQDVESSFLGKPRTAPVLSSFDDAEDNTLRLADLFDDGGV